MNIYIYNELKASIGMNVPSSNSCISKTAAPICMCMGITGFQSKKTAIWPFVLIHPFLKCAFQAADSDNQVQIM